MLEAANLRKRYRQRQVLDGVSLRVADGEIYGFVGGNGAGKTTSMRIMLGVSQSDEGKVLLDGKPIDDRARATIGYMPEERGLYPKMTLVAQLTHFAVLHGVTRHSAHRAAEYWLNRLGLSDRHKSALEDLSLGNQQRVQLAAALVHEPRALVMDEPFSGLDPQAVDVITDVLREEAARGVPVLFSSHQLDLVERMCHRIGILRSGRIIAEGTVAELGASIGEQIVVTTPVPREVWLQGLPLLPAHPEIAHATKARLTRGVAVEKQQGQQTRLRLFGLDSQEVLDAIRNHGRVDGFTPWQPSLQEIYSEAMTDATAANRKER